jgi:hypothetical protein
MADHRPEWTAFSIATAARVFSANEIKVITIAQKIPYLSPFHDKVCEEKLHPLMK